MQSLRYKVGKAAAVYQIVLNQSVIWGQVKSQIPGVLRQLLASIWLIVVGSVHIILHLIPSNPTFVCILRLLNVYRVCLVFGNNLYRIMIPVSHLQICLAAHNVFWCQVHHFKIVQTTFGTFAQLEYIHHKTPTKYNNFRSRFSSCYKN